MTGHPTPKPATGGLHLVAICLPTCAAVAASLLGADGLVLVGIGGVAALLSVLLVSLASTRRNDEPAERPLATLAAATGRPLPDDPAAVAPWAAELADRLRATEGLASDMRAIFDATDAPVLVTGPSGAVARCNRAACEFLRREPEAIIGRELVDFFSQSELLHLHRGAASGSPQRGQVRMAREGVLRTFQVLAAPLAVGGGRGVVLTLRDVTELAAAVQLKTDFVANASHEVRTPLAAIRGAVETMEQLGPEDADMLARLRRMVAANVERLEELTRDLLDLSRLESPEGAIEPGPIDLPELVSGVVAMLEPIAGPRKVTFTVEIEPGAARLRADRRLVTLIVRNLAENAAKFAYEGTDVKIFGRREDGADPGTLRLRVVDRGIGIPLNQQARIFERFFQGDPSRAGGTGRRGTGLGLAIVKHAVRTMGGSIGVESVWKEGTTMTVDLPGCVVADAAA